MTTIDKIFFPLFIVIYVLLMFSCTTATTQEPSAQLQFAAAVQATTGKPKPIEPTTKEAVKPPIDFTAPQYFMTVQIYYYTACDHLYEDPTQQQECLKNALQCATKNVTDVKWLAGCLSEVEQ